MPAVLPDHVSRDTVERILGDLIERRPSLHRQGSQPTDWCMMADTLRWLAEAVRPGQHTLEIGCGASTIVLAAVGARHTSISPLPDEYRQVREYCVAQGVPTDGLTFIEGLSQDVLPSLQLPAPLDLLLIDGAHTFPHPVLDWHYANPHLRVGGLLLLDDAPIPAVGVVCRALDTDPCWQRVAVTDARAVAFRKLAPTDSFGRWARQGFNRGYPDYGFLPLARRLQLTLHARLTSARGALGDRIPALRRVYRAFTSRSSSG